MQQLQGFLILEAWDEITLDLQNLHDGQSINRDRSNQWGRLGGKIQKHFFKYIHVPNQSTNEFQN